MHAARIDHVVLGVRDLDGAARRLLEDFGLASVFGGHHVGWGTGNLIVPLGLNYVELLGVVDEKQATQSVLPQECEVEIMPDPWSPDLMPDPGLLGFSY